MQSTACHNSEPAQVPPSAPAVRQALEELLQASEVQEWQLDPQCSVLLRELPTSAAVGALQDIIGTVRRKVPMALLLCGGARVLKLSFPGPQVWDLPQAVVLTGCCVRVGAHAHAARWSISAHTTRAQSSGGSQTRKASLQPCPESLASQDWPGAVGH